MNEEKDRIIVSHGEWEYGWSIISNPKIDYFTKASNNILKNEANDYVEYKNCGVSYRMIRLKDIANYMIEREEVKEEWILKRVDFEEEPKRTNPKEGE